MPGFPDQRPRRGISVVTPTLRRPDEVRGLLAHLCEQTVQPTEVILVDGAPAGEQATEQVVEELRETVPFRCVYVRHGGGTAIQRNVGIDVAQGQYVAFIDDDVRLAPAFFQVILDVFEQRGREGVGGIVGYRTNKYFAPESVTRWRWYRRLKLLTTYEPGRYDFETGYPINANMQPPFSGVREVDFMTTACAVWRRAVFDNGLRLDPFFRNYGILEDAHLSLRAGRQWTLLQCGDAHCEELSSPNSREGHALLGYKMVVNYYYVFNSVAGPLSRRQKMRFWRYQLVELVRLTYSLIKRRRLTDVRELRGRLKGFFHVARGVAFADTVWNGEDG